MLLRLPVLVLACLLWLSAGGDSQDIATHMRVVRNRNAEMTDKVVAMNALLELGVDAQRQLCAQLQRDCKSLRKRFAKSRGKLLKGFTQAAPRVIGDRLTRDTRLELDKLRETVLRNAQDQQLAKHTIVEESDPALARLEELVSVTPNQVYDVDEKLYGLLIATLDAQSEERVLYGFWSRAGERLLASDEGKKVFARLEKSEDPSLLEDELYDELESIAAFALPMSERDRDVLLANRHIADQVGPLEAAGNEILNLMRIRLGLGALSTDVKLHEASRGHSKDMVDLDFFSHTSPVEGKERFSQRAQLAGTSASAENIAAAQSTAAEVIRGWWHSPGHHRNMLSSGHGRVGLGRYETTWTQMFGR